MLFAWKVWRALHSPLGARPFALKTKTDEAQDVYLTLFRQVVWNVLIRCTISFADMAFGRSVVLHFPQEIQKNLGISEVAPQLLRALDAEMIESCAVPQEWSSSCDLQHC